MAVRLETVMAGRIYSEMHEWFDNVQVNILRTYSNGRMKGHAYIRGIMVEVKLYEKDSEVWHIIDDDYSNLEDIEQNMYLPWDDKECYDNYVAELKEAYRAINMPESEWRIKSFAGKKPNFYLGVDELDQFLKANGH